MRQGPNQRRTRGRNNSSGPSSGPSSSGGGSGSGGGGGGGNGGGGVGRRQNIPLRHQTFDSNGPDVRIRGNAYQVYEKYLALARDTAASGDRVASENYYQHAEHYYRVMNQNTDGPAEPPRPPPRARGEGAQPFQGGPVAPPGGGNPYDDDSDGGDGDVGSVMDPRGGMPS